MLIYRDNLPITHRLLFKDNETYYLLFNNIIKINRKINDRYNIRNKDGSVRFIFYPMADGWFLHDDYIDELRYVLEDINMDDKDIEDITDEIYNFLTGDN